jgi:hypothetical protein
MAKYEVRYSEIYEKHEVYRSRRFWESGLSYMFQRPVFKSKDHREAWDYAKVANEAGTATALQLIELKRKV